ncbi:amino acid/polyamine transporter I [Terfezia claveryi]|nr:amino acid/polyamine transporter I [Terfezia claveryi]
MLFQDHSPRIAKLGIFSTGCLLVNRMIGTGIFEKPKTIWMSTETAAGALFMWVLGGLISYAGMAVYLELGLTIPRYLVHGRWQSVPRSGGEKNYLEYIFKTPKFLATCTYAVIFIFLGNTSGNGIVFATNFLQIIRYPEVVNINDHKTGWIIKGIAVAVVTIACLLHGTWRAGGIWVQNSFAIMKIMILWFFIIAGLAAYSGKIGNVSAPGVDLAVTNSFKADEAFTQHYGPNGWITTLLDVSFSFGGFESANYVLSEVKDPARKLKWSTMGSLTLVFVSYILTNISFMTVVSAKSLMSQNDSTISTVFINTLFHGSDNAKRALPALIAISAFGNISVTTFMTSKVKQEIAKEGVLPFSAFWRSEYHTPFSKLFPRKGHVRPHHRQGTPVYPSIPEERTPIPALLLHWLTSLILILSPPAASGYLIFTRLYSYMTQAWFGIFLAGGLLYVGYFKQYVSDYNGGSYQWKNIAGFRPYFGPLIPAFYFFSSLFMVVGAWVPPQNGHYLAYSTIKWFVIPTIGVGLFAVGVVYWFGLVKVLPIFYHKTLRVRRTPYLDRDENFRFEEVTTQWIAGAEQSDEEEDPDLVS